jgi:hypothetical protein
MNAGRERSGNIRASYGEGLASMGTIIEVEPAEGLADEPVAVKLRGLPPGRRIVVKAEARLGAEPPWRSQAELVVDDSGIVDLARHTPEAGSYQGIEPMGLFWSMLPEPGASSLVDLYSTLESQRECGARRRGAARRGLDVQPFHVSHSDHVCAPTVPPQPRGG